MKFRTRLFALFGVVSVVVVGFVPCSVAAGTYRAFERMDDARSAALRASSMRSKARYVAAATEHGTKPTTTTETTPKSAKSRVRNFMAWLRINSRGRARYPPGAARPCD